MKGNRGEGGVRACPGEEGEGQKDEREVYLEATRLKFPFCLIPRNIFVLVLIEHVYRPRRFIDFYTAFSW